MGISPTRASMTCIPPEISSRTTSYSKESARTTPPALSTLRIHKQTSQLYNGPHQRTHTYHVSNYKSLISSYTITVKNVTINTIITTNNSPLPPYRAAPPNIPPTYPQILLHPFPCPPPAPPNRRELLYTTSLCHNLDLLLLWCQTLLLRCKGCLFSQTNTREDVLYVCTGKVLGTLGGEGSEQVSWGYAEVVTGEEDKGGEF
ncbi:hypothetical protein BJ508DRAFT_419902 [Ascobolus immersus RN42]|uniref:Uncharacterized protein n=1 Tax=Ascobolus immersus RN42 TaxID=1160509 RepID=A0A3N4HA58_ASCIM|nr:hypothetical protein BJ508DRAFT_419902 [Ascobolus immersus RN42]